MENLKRNLHYKKIGLYKIKSNIDKRVYIGSTSCLYRRINYHLNLLRKNKHDNSKLQNFFNKYGECSLEIEIVKILYNSKNLTILEKELIDMEDPRNLLNIELDPILPNRAKSTEITKEKLKNSWKENRDAKLSAVLENLKKAQSSGYKPDGSAWIGRKHKESSKKLMSESARKRGHNGLSRIKVSRYDKQENYIDSFNSLTEAAEFCFNNKRLVSNIGKVLSGERKYCGGYIFKKD